MASGYVQEAKKQTDNLNRQQSMTLAYFGALLADVDYNQVRSASGSYLSPFLPPIIMLYLHLQLLQTLDCVNSWTLKLDKLAETLAGHTQQSKDVVSYLVE